jgi:hypothetical protein
MDYINATLEMCTLYKDIPHGISIINYKDLDDEAYSFRGWKMGDLQISVTILSSIKMGGQNM